VHTDPSFDPSFERSSKLKRLSDVGTFRSGTKDVNNSMKWFSATLISVIRLRDSGQDSYPVWEDVCLIEASTVDEAFEKAEILGKSREGDDPDLTLDDQPATISFLGVRKLTPVINPIDMPKDAAPGHGSEVAFSKYRVSSTEDLDKLVRGDGVPVVYEE
jgi:hypothetical protein